MKFRTVLFRHECELAYIGQPNQEIANGISERQAWPLDRRGNNLVDILPGAWSIGHAREGSSRRERLVHQQDGGLDGESPLL
jgi:hypothetical protein